MQNLPQKQIDRIVLAIFSVLALSLISSTINKISVNYRLQGEIELLTAEVEVLKLENQNIKYRLAYYESDEYVELKLKEADKVARPGEKVVFLEKDIRPSIDDEESSIEPEVMESKSNLQLWIDFFRGV